LFEFKTSPVRVPVYVSAAIVLAVFTVSYADLQRREEKNFLHNLGMPVLLVSAIATILQLWPNPRSGSPTR